MSLGLKTIRTSGRASKVPIVLGSGDLTAEMLEARRTREAGIGAPALARLSARHHKLAQLVASGATNSQCSAETGLCASRVSILKANSSFQDLVAYYKEMQGLNRDLYFERLGMMSLEAIDVLHERLESEADGFDNTELMKLVTITADRTGHAPKRVEEKNINVNFGDRLEEARRRAREARTIDVTPKEISANE